MQKYMTPRQLRKEDMDLLTAFNTIAGEIGVSNEEVLEAYELLPEPLKFAPSFRDIKRILRYEYGELYLFNQGSALGTDQINKVSVLLKGVLALTKHVSKEQMKIYLKKLNHKNKHHDFLTELDPIIRPRINFGAVYEPDRYAKGNKRIDWLIEFDEECNFLIDVKNRIGALLNAFDNVFKTGDITEPHAPSPEGIFRSIEDKFNIAQDSILNGIWIRTDAYYNDELLNKEFDRLNSNLVQFAVLTHFEGEARILARTPEIRSLVLSKFSLKEMSKRVWK